MKKYTYKLKILSSVILSPRAQNAFYVDDERDFNIIYPFYQYGTYDQPCDYDESDVLVKMRSYTEENEEKAKYYIPGSSMKGAMGAPKYMVDDIPIAHGELELRSICKLQYIPRREKEESSRAGDSGNSKTEQNTVKKMKLTSFFPNIRIQMLKAGELGEKGTLFGQGDLHKDLSDNQERTISKICEYQKRLKDIIALAQKNGADTDGKCISILQAVIKNLNDRMGEKEEDEFLFILGGYKGQLLSMISSEDSEGAVYLDGIKDKDSPGTENGALGTEKDTENTSGYLPHGLVTIKIIG